MSRTSFGSAKSAMSLPFFERYRMERLWGLSEMVLMGEQSHHTNDSVIRRKMETRAKMR